MSSRIAFGALLVFAFVLPGVAEAFPFGGRTGTVLQCVYNTTIYANIGPPRGGEYIWTTSTRTYQFGPPAYAGQWLLGLAGAPYYCIYRISPLTIYTGIAITMMGSSGPGAPPAPPTRGPTLATGSHSPSSPGTADGGSSSGGGSTSPPSDSGPPHGSTGKVLISEVYHAADSTRGGKPDGEWIEIYNDTSSPVSVGGWKIEDAIESDVLPAITLPPDRFLIVAANDAVRDAWDIPAGAKFVSLDGPVGDGLANDGDRVVLRNASGAVVDAISWGANETVFDPGVTAASYGMSLARVPLSNDTNAASDWAPRPPSPGW